MRRRETNVNVRTHSTHAAQRNGGTGQLADVEAQHGEPEPPNPSPLPYLEDIMAIASKYPYSALAAMIAVASLVVGTIVTLGVAGFTGAFLMYGEMTNTRAKLDNILEQQVEIKGQVSVIKTIHQATLARQDFMNGLMSKENQDALNAYDRTHPRIPVPESEAKQ